MIYLTELGKFYSICILKQFDKICRHTRRLETEYLEKTIDRYSSNFIEMIHSKTIPNNPSCHVNALQATIGNLSSSLTNKMLISIAN